jgi:hypothetical protein
MSFSPSPSGLLENEAAALGKRIADANTDEPTSDCDSCASSQTSTDLYDHEPFETFAHKVHSLLITMFPDELPIQVEHISGGSYNRVVRWKGAGGSRVGASKYIVVVVCGSRWESLSI